MAREDDEFNNKYNMTYTLLQRILTTEDFQHIKSCEPVIVHMTDDSKSPNSKKLKSPGYKHAIISSKSLFIINTPAKIETDLLLTLDLDEVSNVELVYDNADFLQGDLKKTAQHIKVTRSNASIVYNETGASLTSSKHSPTSSFNSNINDSSELISRLNLNSSQRLCSNKLSKNLEQYRSISNGTNSIVQSSKSHRKTKKGRSPDVPKRPLPLPLNGTETINAMYTKKNSPKNRLLRSMSPSKSCNNLAEISKHLKPSEPNSNLMLSSSHSRSWNDVAKAGLKSPQIERKVEETVIKYDANLENLSSTESIPTPSLGQSFSSKMMNRLKGTHSTHTAPSITDTQSITMDKCDVDIYTVDVKTNLYNLIRESWMQSLLLGTYNMNKSGPLNKSPSLKVNLDDILQKFTSIKEEILRCTEDDELFMLTKEIVYACKHYHSIKKKAWSSGPMIKFYLRKMKKLLVSDDNQSTNNRMDEIDILIIIGELFICLFQGSELYSARNHMLNENKALLVTQLIQCILSPLNFNQEFDKEFEELFDTWMDTSVALLYEIVYAANNAYWNYKIDNRSFDVPKVAQCLVNNEENVPNGIWPFVLVNNAEQYYCCDLPNLMIVIGHIVKSLISSFHVTIGTCLTPRHIALMYKELVVLQFIGSHCPQLRRSIKFSHQEEMKYYIRGPVVDRIPDHYPLTPVLKVLVPDVVQMFTL